MSRMAPWSIHSGCDFMRAMGIGIFGAARADDPIAEADTSSPRPGCGDHWQRSPSPIRDRPIAVDRRGPRGIQEVLRTGNGRAGTRRALMGATAPRRGPHGQVSGGGEQITTDNTPESDSDPTWGGQFRPRGDETRGRDGGRGDRSLRRRLLLVDGSRCMAAPQSSSSSRCSSRSFSPSSSTSSSRGTRARAPEETRTSSRSGQRTAVTGSPVTAVL